MVSPSDSSNVSISPGSPGRRPQRFRRFIQAGPIGLLSPLFSILGGHLRPPLPRPPHREGGRVFIVPGIEGSTWQLAGCVKGLCNADIDRPIECIPWGKRPFRQLYNLMASKAGRRAAECIAERIAACHAAHPQAPITLVGYSGGGGIVALVAESLPDGVTLDRLITIAAAISPGYDLGRVLPHTRNGIVNFYSPGDWLVLGAGTSVFGTIDRRHGPSAGCVGFQDGDGRVIQSPIVKQIAWHPDWLDLGHNGGHFGWLSTNWSREILAPQIRPLDHASAPGSA